MSGDIYNKNIEALKKRNMDVVECLRDANNWKNCEDKDYDVWVDMINNRKILHVRKDNRVYQLNSSYDDDYFVQVWVQSIRKKWDLNTRINMFGFGNGIYVRKFLETTREDCAIIVYEPSKKIFQKVIEEYDISDIILNRRFRLVFGPSLRNVRISELFRDIISFSDIFTLSFARYINYYSLFPNNWDEYYDELIRLIDFVKANQYVITRFGLDYNNNLLNNYVNQFPDSYSLYELKDILLDSPNVPIIIVAAGPSLDGNINELKNAKGKSIIIATDTALRPLCRAGIIPDIAVALDGKKDERYLSEPESLEVPLVCEISSGRKLLNTHIGKKFFSVNVKGLINYGERNDINMVSLETGHSVANMCLSLGIFMGAKTFIFVGQDLAYTDAKTHSTDTVRGEKYTKEDDLEHMIWGTDIKGNPIRTSGEFQVYQKWFEEHIRDNSENMYIDSTEGGVYITGTEIMDLKESVQKYCKDAFSFSEIIDNTSQILSERDKRDFYKYVYGLVEECNYCKCLIQENINYYREMKKILKSGKKKSDRIIKLYNMCNRNTERLDKSDAMYFIINQLQGESADVYQNVNKIENNEDKELMTACTMGEEYLVKMEMAVNEFKDIVIHYLG